MTTGRPRISILTLTYNAAEFVRISIESLRSLAADDDYELVVVDNASEEPTRTLVRTLHTTRHIDRLELSDVNTLFAGGNTIAANLADPESDYLLLLNSDVEVLDSDWLTNLLSHHARGLTTYWLAPDPLRVDGYCLLIDADLYRTTPLYESHQWWWSSTTQHAQVMQDGQRVAGFAQHGQYFHHFGGKSGSGFKSAKGMQVPRHEVHGWFAGRQPLILDQASTSLGRLAPPTRYVRVRRRLGSMLQRAGLRG